MQNEVTQVKKELVETGKIRFVFHDFPLDQVALTAAVVARHLPAASYDPFVSALLASQDRWALARGVNTTDELAKMAALAGLSRAAFRQNQFGGVFGGRIIRNRTFFFGDYQGTRQRTAAASSIGSLPPDAIRAGDLSSLRATANSFIPTAGVRKPIYGI